MDHLTMPLMILGSVLIGGGIFMAGALFGAVTVYMTKFKGPYAEMPQGIFARSPKGEIVYENADDENDAPLPTYEEIYPGIAKHNVALGKENMPEVAYVGS